jgi:hypothetical protein
VQQLHDAAQDIIRDPEHWEPKFAKLEALLRDANAPISAQLASDIRLDALAIIRDDPKCEQWVRDVVVAAAAQLGHTATRVQLPDYYCPDVPSHVGAAVDAKVTIHGFTSLIDRQPTAVLKVTDRSLSREPVSFGNGRVEFDASTGSCTDGKLQLIQGNRSVFSITIDASNLPEPSCKAKASQIYSAKVSDCSNECCHYSSVADCISRRCDAECASRTANNPPGHPAIGDACSTSGAFYNWCHSYCNSWEACDHDWCGQSAPRRDACLVQAKNDLQDALTMCPRATGCSR